MKVCVVVAYPNHDGLIWAAYERLIAGLTTAGHEVRALDLYAEGFDPVLRFDAGHPRHLLKDDPATRVYRDDVVWSDLLVFVFPIWWGGMPAMLKGFVDRVFAKGFAYDYAGMRPIGNLGGRAAWIITTNDTPAWYSRLFYQDYGAVLARQVLGFSGIEVTRRSTLACVRGTSARRRERWLDGIGRLAAAV
jgi:NAD(P)H dehydrogenase (quinone)